MKTVKETIAKIDQAIQDCKDTHIAWGGSSLVYNDAIIENIYPRYMVAGMIRKCDKGYFQPLDVQAALLKTAFIRTWWKFAEIQSKEGAKKAIDKLFCGEED